MRDSTSSLPDSRPGQDLIAAGLQTHIDHGQALFPKRPQLLLCPDADGGGRGVAGHLAALREQLPDRVQDDVQLGGFADQGVPVGQEDLFHIAVDLSGGAEVLQHLLQGPDGKALFLVHAAKGAGVVAASIGDLDNETAGLRGGAIDTPDITHGETSYF